MTLNHSERWAHGLRTPPSEASALLSALAGAAALDRAATAGPAARRALSLTDAYTHSARITRHHSRSFFLSSQLLPPEKRRAVPALYAFCRVSDDLVDCAEGDARQVLASWVALAQAPCSPTDDPVLLAWKDTAARYCIPGALVDEFLAGLAMNLIACRYPTFDALWWYCYRVASVVGLLTMRIVGSRPGAAQCAVNLGIALQLTNILRDVGEDAARGRIYLPQEDLARFDLCDDDILAARLDRRFRALMRFEIERAHQLYAEAKPGIALLCADSQLAIGAAAEICRGILAKIVASDYDVFGRHAQLACLEKVLLAAKVWRART